MNSNPYDQVLAIFFNQPTKIHYIREIARTTKLSVSVVSKYLDKLQNDSLILKTIELKNTKKYPQFVANLDSEQFAQQKKLHNLKQILNSNIVEELINTYTPSAIILFGSYLDATNIETSDIDIAVIGSSNKSEVSAEKLQKMVNLPIQLHNFLTIQKIDKNVLCTLINGYVLYGYLDVASRIKQSS
jgi:predicted nucleotidyltransferase